MIKNAIVVMFDTLQYNYLGCYGNEWIQTPNMDRLAREGVLFERCYSEGLPTIPCRRAMLTGRFTIHKAAWVPLSMDDTTIADLCWGRPIDTFFVFDAPPMRLPKFGYSRGFDKVWFIHGHETDQAYYSQDPLYHKNPMDYVSQNWLENADKIQGGPVMKILLEEIEDFLKQRQYWRSEEDRYVARTMKAAVDMLEKVDRNKQFFMWVDSFDPHDPWDGPSVYLDFPCPYDPTYTGKDLFLPLQGLVEGLFTEEELHHIRMLYAECVTVCDRWFGHLMDAVRRLGFEDNTLFWLVSDHGQPLGNGEHGHGLMRKSRPWPYNELVHTPMLLRVPGVKPGQRIDAFVQSCDVAPTVCDWLGIGVHPSMQGKSLLPLIRGEVDKVRDFAIAGYCGYSWAIYTEEYSFIHWMKLNKGEGREAQGEYYWGMFGEEVAKISPEASQDPVFGRFVTGNQDGSRISDAVDDYKKKATLDGEDQWTCTPGSVASVPEKDELYDNRTDPMQLHNIAAQYPEKCVEMLNKLHLFMEELRSS